MKIGRLLGAAGFGLLMAAAFSATALAAQPGWVKEDGAIRYVDANGNYVKNGWRDFQGKTYYLDSSGNAATDTWVENTYYVDDKGLMVKNSWIHDPGKSGQKAEGWYFMGNDGKAEKDGWRTIENARYSFDKDGKMRTGWHYEDGDIYYLGGQDEGFVTPGWRCLEYDEKNRPKEGAFSKEYDGEDGRGSWFYFQQNGKAKHSRSQGYEAVAIEGKKFYFDQNGVMLTGWHAVREKGEPGDGLGISRFLYLGNHEEGIVKKQWRELEEHPGNSADKDILNLGQKKYSGPKQGQKAWYYFGSDGTPAFLSNQDRTLNAAVVKIDGESYFFDAYGCLRTGLVRLNADGKGQTGYFGENQAEAFMRTGKVKGVEDKAGRENEFYFGTVGSEKGVGCTGEKDGFLYVEGALAKAKDGSGYQPFEAGGTLYLVNEAGKVQTDEQAYSTEGTYLYRIKDGVLYTADEKGNKDKKVEKGESMPRIAFDYVYTAE